MKFLQYHTQSKSSDYSIKYQQLLKIPFTDLQQDLQLPLLLPDGFFWREGRRVPERFLDIPETYSTCLLLMHCSYMWSEIPSALVTGYSPVFLGRTKGYLTSPPNAITARHFGYHSAAKQTTVYRPLLA